MTSQQGYLSGRCTQVTIAGIARLCLDGEPFDADPSRPAAAVARGIVLRVLRA